MRVLVAYATRNGSTAGIAQVIGAELQRMGLGAEIREASEVRDVSRCDAVVLGSALYMGHWQKAALKFGKRYADELAALPVWLFASGPLDRSAEETEIPPVEAAAELSSRIHARGHRTFGGRVTEETRGFIAQSMVKQGRGGDFRNFDRVREWAREIGAELLGRPPLAAAGAGAVEDVGILGVR